MTVDSTVQRKTAAPQTAMGRVRRMDRSVYLSIAVGLAGVALTLGPIFYLVLGGFRSQADLAGNPTGFPDPFQWQNYWDILSTGVFWRQVLNSALVAVATTAGVVLFGTMAAYPLARYAF